MTSQKKIIPLRKILLWSPVFLLVALLLGANLAAAYGGYRDARYRAVGQSLRRSLESIAAQAETFGKQNHTFVGFDQTDATHMMLEDERTAVAEHLRAHYDAALVENDDHFTTYFGKQSFCVSAAVPVTLDEFTFVCGIEHGRDPVKWNESSGYASCGQSKKEAACYTAAVHADPTLFPRSQRAVGILTLPGRWLGEHLARFSF